MSLSLHIVQQFFPQVLDFEAEALGSGLIHQTLEVKTEAGSYVFQRLNQHVFPHLEEMMANISKVTEALTKEGENTLHFQSLAHGSGYLATNPEGEQWRCSKLVPGTTTYDLPPTPAHLKNAARAFARFAKTLSQESLELFPTIRDFHNTPKRFETMEAAWKAAKPERQSAADYYAIRHAGTAFEEFGLKGLLAPDVPQAVSHNDTKLNNCLFLEGSEEVHCVIDLDTVMEGSWLMDFGDLCRTAICAQPEDTQDLDLIDIDLPRFQALVEGYAEIFGRDISKTEQQRLVYSVFLLTYELALRFFTDHLEEDVYFGAAYADHNLVRARAQLTLALKVLSAREEMEKIVERSFAQVES